MTIFLHEAIAKVKSQKAKGVLNIAYHNHCGLLYHPIGVLRPQATIYPYAFDGNFDHFLGQIGLFPESHYFARPCPLRPRHGFVESRKLKGYQALVDIYNETQAAEPGGEVLVMPVYTGKASAVATSAGIAWGKDHDGATSGKGALNIPTPCQMDTLQSWNWWKMFSRTNMGIEKNPFLEIVENHGVSYLVQVRDGPDLPTTNNYVPDWVATTKITQVLQPHFSDTSPEALLRWEAHVEEALKANGGHEGLALYLPGHTLGSHYAVHGIQHDIAVITEPAFKPYAGDFLAMPPSGIGKMGKADLLELREMIDALREKNINSEAQSLVNQAVSSLHSCSLWDNSKHFLQLRANMVVTVARCLASATIGEDRYFYTNGPGNRGGGEEACEDRDCEVCKPIRSKRGYRPLRISHVKRFRNRDVSYSREMAYQEMFGTPWHGLTPEMRDARADFDLPGWRSSFGGRNWRNCTDAGINLIARIDDFLKKPTAFQWKRVMAATNKGVNIVHNSGSCLTKWINKDTMTWLANCPVLGFMSQATPKTLGV